MYCVNYRLLNEHKKKLWCRYSASSVLVLSQNNSASILLQVLLIYHLTQSFQQSSQANSTNSISQGGLLMQAVNQVLGMQKLETSLRFSSTAGGRWLKPT
jgi:hypothetical protein